MADDKGIGDRYQQETKYSRDDMGSSSGIFERAGQHKRYPDAEKVLPLPKAKDPAAADFWDVLNRRRSQRNFSSKTMPLDDLALLIAATQGLTGPKGQTMFRAAPSAGALYPVETYMLVNRVQTLDTGIYHLNSFDQTLELIRRGDHGKTCAQAALGQNMAGNSAATFIWTAIPGRSKWKYHERAYRYIYLDAGHIGQNLYLAATALGLGCCTIGAFFDSEINDLIGIDGQTETAIYLGTVGSLHK